MPSIAGEMIPEALMAQDFELTKLYQSYSSELLRLSLAGIGVVGFLISNLELMRSKNGEKFLVGVGVIGLVTSAGSALLHRYLSSDSMAYFVAHLRVEERLKRKADLAESEVELLNGRSKIELDEFKRLIGFCDTALKASAISLAVGVAMVALGVLVKMAN